MTKYRCVHFDGQKWINGNLIDRASALILVLFKRFQGTDARLENENGTEEKA